MVVDPVLFIGEFLVNGLEAAALAAVGVSLAAGPTIAYGDEVWPGVVDGEGEVVGADSFGGGAVIIGHFVAIIGVGVDFVGKFDSGVEVFAGFGPETVESVEFVDVVSGFSFCLGSHASPCQFWF